MFFLFLFSYVLLCDFDQIDKRSKRFQNTYSLYSISISIPEIILIIWVSVFTLEEIRKCIKNESNVWKGKLKGYLLNNWNSVTVVSILLFFIGITLRFIPNEKCFLAARVILCIDIIIWYFNGLKAYRFIRSVGPMMVVFEKMTLQLFYFIVVALVFIFAFGVATQSLMYPNQVLDKFLLKNIFFPGFFVFGKEYYTRQEIMDGLNFFFVI